MTTWLDEIVEAWEDVGTDSYPPWVEDMRRMARVIREQSQRIKLWLALGRITEEDLDGMSDDAKQLLMKEMSIKEAYDEMKKKEVGGN